METTTKPAMSLLKTGDALKVIQVAGTGAMLLPAHISTQEALVIVQKGSAVLTIEEKEHLLSQGDVFVIPAHQKHFLLLKETFEGLIIMQIDAKMKFENKT